MFFNKKKIVPLRSKPESKEKSGIDSVELILGALADPIIVLDEKRVVKYANEAAHQLFGRVSIGRNIVQSIRQPHVVDAIERVYSTKQAWIGDASFPAPVRRHLTLHVALVGEGEGVCITVRDTTLVKRTEEMHSDFVANVSHELRSPLSAMLGFIETLQGPAQDDKEARVRFLEIMIQEGHRMARLIDDLLSLSRVQMQEHVAPDDSVHLNLVLQNVVDILSLKATEQGMSLKLTFPDDDIWVRGDADQMTQVFQNLIVNALKYGKNDTPVDIVCGRLQRMPDRNVPAVFVEVHDQGDGIDEEHLPRLTERFYRIDKARSRSLGGTGLGLAIVKHIIARHRGRLQVESKVGKGSTFRVILPART